MKSHRIEYRNFFPHYQDEERYYKQHNERLKHGKWIIYSRLTGNGKTHVFAVFDDSQYQIANAVFEDLVHDPDCATSNKYHCDRSWWLQWKPSFKSADKAYQHIHRQVKRYERRQSTIQCEHRAKRNDSLDVFSFREW